MNAGTEPVGEGLVSPEAGSVSFEAIVVILGHLDSPAHSTFWRRWGGSPELANAWRLFDSVTEYMTGGGVPMQPHVARIVGESNLHYPSVRHNTSTSHLNCSCGTAAGNTTIHSSRPNDAHWSLHPSRPESRKRSKLYAGGQEGRSCQSPYTHHYVILLTASWWADKPDQVTKNKQIQTGSTLFSLGFVFPTLTRARRLICPPPPHATSLRRE